MSVFLVSGFLTVQAHASGCDYRTNYVFGQHVETAVVAAVATCKDAFPGYLICSLNVAYQEGLQLEAYYLPAKQKPETNDSIAVTVNVFEAMAWDGCAEDEPAPEYKMNGYYSTTTINDVEYMRFNYKH
jgi:hypothetical protein